MEVYGLTVKKMKFSWAKIGIFGPKTWPQTCPGASRANLSTTKKSLFASFLLLLGMNHFWTHYTVIGCRFRINTLFQRRPVYSESYGSKEHSGNLILISWVEMKTPGILSSLRTQTGP